MASARSRSGLDAVHPSRQAQVPGSTKKPTKPRKAKPPIYKKQAHASSVNAIKKRIRDVKRRLERSEILPATVRVEDERALVIYEQELATANEEKIRQRMIKKYHMVRFFERQKATRQLKKLRKRLLEAKSDDVVKTLKAKLHIAEVDLNYTQYYPLYQRYISLYPQKDSLANETEIQDEQVTDSSKKPAIWAEVEKRMADGTLDQLRNGSIATVVHQGKRENLQDVPTKSKARLNDTKSSSKTTLATKPSKMLANSSGQQDAGHSERNNLRKAAIVEGVDDESDGGFFE